jgi:hypothetical protein
MGTELSARRDGGLEDSKETRQDWLRRINDLPIMRLVPR